MQRIYHHYEKWEEFHAGMWKKAAKEKESNLFQKAIIFTGNAEIYGEYMLKAIVQWPISCEQNLTDPSMNRQAWIGHAACCIAIGCPEYITRLAWWELSQEQRDKANAKADFAISQWEFQYKSRNQLCLKFQ